MEDETTETELQTISAQKQQNISTNDIDYDTENAGSSTTLKATQQEEEKVSKTDNLRIGSVSSAGSNNNNDDIEFEEELSSWNKLRKFVRLDIIQTSWFETVILIVIIINCVFLAIDNPTNESKTLEQIILITEIVFTTIYIIEMILKWIGLGFFGRHMLDDSGNDKNKDQKNSVFSYMVNSVFNGEEQKPKRDEYVGYFLDGWNVLDFVVVVAGSIVPLALGPAAASIGSIRALRILRALRTIPRVPKLRTLVMTIIDAIPGWTGSFILLSFFFMVFGIVGIQLFHGQLKQQCTTIDENGNRIPLRYRAVDSDYIALCRYDESNSNGKVYFGAHVEMQSCNDVAVALGMDAVYECTNNNKNPVAGMQNYDNIFYSLLQVFQTITLQDWSSQMYNLSRGSGYIVALFFVPLTFLVSFFAINLILAVIVDTYSHTIHTVTAEEDQDSTLHEMDKLIEAKTSKRTAIVKQQITYDSYPRKLRALKEKVKTFEELFKEYNQGPVERANKTHELQRKGKMRLDTARQDMNADVKSIHLELAAIADEVQKESKEDLYDDDDEKMKPETWSFTKRADEQKTLRREMIGDMMLNFNKDLAFEVWLLARPIKDDWLMGKEIEDQSKGDERRFYQKRKPMFIRWLHFVSTSEWFEKVIIFIILLNTILLSIHWPDMNDDLSAALEALNYVFTAIFALELVIKMLGLGPERWWYDKFNVFDAVIVVISLIELCLPNTGGGFGGALLAFRALRVLRVLRLLHQIPGLSVLFNSILNSFEPVVFLVLILLLFVFMFGVLGVQLFAGSIYPAERENADGSLSGFLLMTRPWRFDSLWYSMIAFLQLFTGDGWPSIMEDTVNATDNESSAIVVIIAVIIGLWLFKNMFLAILINRMSNQDNIQLMIDELLNLAREKQRLFDEKTAIKEFEKDVRRIRKERMGSHSASKHQQIIEAIEASKKITGKSFGCLLPTNSFRVFLHGLVSSDVFEWAINILIVINCFFLACNGPHVPIPSPLSNDFGSILRYLDFVFTSIFFIEMILKMIAFGIWKSKSAEDKATKEEKEKKQRERRLAKHKDPNYKIEEEDPANMVCTNAYLESWWNRLDALIVLLAIIGLPFPSVGFLRGFRAIRPIRIAIRIPQVRVVVKALIASLGQVVNAVCFSFFIIFVLGIVGLQLFSGQFGRCVYDNGNAFDVVIDSAIENSQDCVAANYNFLNPGYNFDNIFVSLLTVFKVSMFSNWYDELSAGMASGGSFDDASPFAAIPYNRPFAASFFVLIVIISGFFVLNIIISVVVDSFNKIKNEDEANALLTPQQVQWVRKRRFLNRFPLRDGNKVPKGKFQLFFFNIVERAEFEYFIIFCILLNTLFLMTEHDQQPQYWKDALFALEIVFIIIYCIEAAAKLIAYGIFPGYFGDWWNVFDFVIIIASIVGLFFDQSNLAVVRLLRVLRIIRLVKKAPLLRAICITLAYALPSLLNIGLLLLVIFFIFGIFGVELFGKVVHSDGYGNVILYDSNEGLSPSVNFEYFANALLILYRTATNDNWGSILLAAGTPNCDDALIDAAGDPFDGKFEYKCGNMPAAVIYFVLFSIFGTFVLINLFIAVILDTYIDNVEFEQKMVKLELLNDWKAKWLAKSKKRHGNKLKPRLPIKQFVATLKESPILIGVILDALNLRLNIEDTDAEIDYEDTEEIKRRSTETYNKLDFVGKANAADKEVRVCNDHLNAIFKTRRLRILCSYRGSNIDEKLVVTYSDALFAICSLLVGPEFRLLPYDNNKKVHISDWWAEQLEDMMDQ